MLSHWKEKTTYWHKIPSPLRMSTFAKVNLHPRFLCVGMPATQAKQMVPQVQFSLWWLTALLVSLFTCISLNFVFQPPGLSSLGRISLWFSQTCSRTHSLFLHIAFLLPVRVNWNIPHKRAFNNLASCATWQQCGQGENLRILNFHKNSSQKLPARGCVS